MAKYCIFASWPRYGSRDEYIGSSHRREQCFKKLGTAEKALKKKWETEGHDELHFHLCRGETYCQPYDKRAIRRLRKKEKRKPSTSRSRRAMRRDIPF